MPKAYFSYYVMTRPFPIMLTLDQLCYSLKLHFFGINYALKSTNYAFKGTDYAFKGTDYVSNLSIYSYIWVVNFI